MERLQLEYNEKRSNVMSLLGRVRQVLGLPPGPDNRIPAAALAVCGLFFISFLDKYE